MRFASGSHASGFQIHIYASVPAPKLVFLGVGYLTEGTHAESVFSTAFRIRRTPNAGCDRSPDRRTCIRDLSCCR